MGELELELTLVQESGPRPARLEASSVTTLALQTHLEIVEHQRGRKCILDKKLACAINHLMSKGQQSWGEVVWCATLKEFQTIARIGRRCLLCIIELTWSAV